MAIVKIVPYASHNQRDSIPVSAGTLVTKDQRLINVYPEVIKNPITGKISVSLKRRPGFISDSAGPGSPFVPTAMGSHYITTSVIALPMTAYFRATVTQESRIYLNTIYVGNIAYASAGPRDYYVRKIDQTQLNSIGINVLSVGDTFGGFALSGATSLYYYPYTLYPSNPVFSATFSGNTHTNTTIDGIADTTGFYVGQALSGTGIQAGTRIATITSSVAITTTLATTGTATVTITREILAKVIDTDLPTNLVGGVAFLSGFMFVMTAEGKVYQTDINTVHSITSGNYILADDSPDAGIGVVRQGDEIVGLGVKTIQFFFNNENSTGSILSRVKGGTINIGVASEWSYCKVSNDKLAFISGGDSGKSLWILSGRTPTKVSSNREDAILTNSAYDWYLSSGYIDGQLMIFCVLSDQSIGLVYCVESGAWWELSASTLYLAMTINAYQTYVINNTNTNGFLQRTPNLTATMDYRDASTTGVSAVPTATVILDIGDLGTLDRKDNRGVLGFDMDTQTATSNVAVSFNDKDFDSASWTTARNVDTTLERKELYRNGSFFHRAIKLTHSDNTGMRLRTIYADIQ